MSSAETATNVASSSARPADVESTGATDENFDDLPDLIEFPRRHRLARSSRDEEDEDIEIDDDEIDDEGSQAEEDDEEYEDYPGINVVFDVDAIVDAIQGLEEQLAAQTNAIEKLCKVLYKRLA